MINIVKKYVVPVILTPLLSLAIGCSTTKSASDHKNELDLKDVGSKKTVVLNQGQTFKVQVDENPTTGYRWQLVLDNANVELVKEDYQSSAKDEMIVGAGGIKYYEFRALKPGNTKATFTHGRSWEQSNKTTKTINFKIK